MSAIPSANFTATIRNTNGAPVVRIADTTPYPTVGGTAETRATATVTIDSVPTNEMPGTAEVRASYKFTIVNVPVPVNSANPFGMSIVNSMRSGTGPLGKELIADVVFSLSDTTNNQVAQRIANAINLSGTGYDAVVVGNEITIYDKAGNGSQPNGGTSATFGDNLSNSIGFSNYWGGGVDVIPASSYGITLINPAISQTIVTYYIQPADTTEDAIAASIAAAINTLAVYSAAAVGNVITISDAVGRGDLSNSGTNVSRTYINCSSFASATPFTGGVDAVPGENTVEDAIGYVTVTQPDGITINIGSFASPSIAWASGAQTIAEGVLRLATDSAFQNGTYSITMHTRLTGYDDTVTTKTFVLDYSKPVAVLQPAFDLFTPSIRMQDSTDYVVAGLTLQSVTRSWSGNVVSVGAVSAGNVNPFDMVRSGNYYDALYTATLTAVAQWQIAAATWVTVIDTIAGTESEDAHAVATPDELIALLNSMFDNLSGDSLCACSSQREQYVFAKTVFDHLMQRGRCGDTEQLYDMYRKLRMAINSNWTIATHDQSVLTAYDFNDFCGV